MVAVILFCPFRIGHQHGVAAANAAPVASFTATPASWNAPVTVTFNDRSTGNITGWQWDFGDGTQSSTRNAVHQYSKPGQYSVGLTVTGPDGANTSSKNNFITVEPYVPVGNNEYLVSIDTALHQKFGLYYPVTYKFRLPPQAQNLSAQYRYWQGNWKGLPEKKSGDVFNGIDAVRFDYAAGLAYVSVRLAASSDNIYLRILDANGQPVTLQFDSIPRYYDDRKGAVTITLDDWNISFDSYFQSAMDYLAARSLYSSVAVVAGDVNWNSLQQKINQYGNLIEIASHSLHHPCTAANYLTYGYDVESAGSRDAFRNNLIFDANPYVPLFVEPCGYSDDALQSSVAAAGYLLSRSTNNNAAQGSVFSSWDQARGNYSQAAVTYDDDIANDDSSLLTEANTSFDKAMADGGIYHLMDHPSKGFWHDGGYLLQHLDYVKGRGDVWYVPFGQLYLYHYLQELRGNLTLQRLGAASITAGFTAVPTGGINPLTVSFTDTSTGSVTGWQWDFGDSTTSTLQNPVHVYTAPGVYTVKLTASGGGNTDTRTQSNCITVNSTVTPTVNLTSPANAATFAAPANIPIAATASPGTGGTVTRVDFYADGMLVGSSTASPYRVTWNGVPSGNYVLSATVTDSLGATASTGPISITVATPSLPVPWQSQDIGSVGLTGSGGFLSGTLTEQGAGADIWGASDAFRYTFQPMNGDGQMIARVATLQNADQWAKSGVMIRETLAANSSHALMAITASNGAAFQRRTATGGSSTHTTGPYVAAPYWVKLVRAGNSFSGYISADGTNWTLVASDTIAMASSVYVGLAVTSHTTAALCQTTMDGISATGVSIPPAVNISAPSDGTAFTTPASIPITASATAGTGATVSKVEFYAGSTLAGTATTTPYSVAWSNAAVGIYSLTAKVTDSLGATATSAAVAIRVADPTAAMVSITAPVPGASFTSLATIPITAVATAGDGPPVSKVDFYAGSALVGTATASPYSVTWNNVAAGSYSLTAKVTDSQGGTATSIPVSITVSGTALPLPWATQDVGSVGLAGSATYSNGIFSLKGAGNDIWGTADGFRFVYQPLTGDGQIVARVATVQNTSQWAKAGVMIRQSLTQDSVHTMMDITPGSGAEFSRRTATSDSTTVSASSGIVAPYWVKLVRSGNTLTGSISADGSNWVQVGSNTVAMTGTVYMGIVLTSHDNTTLGTATVDGVSVIGTASPPTVAITAPSVGSSFAAPAGIPIAATATAGTGATVSKVDFYSGSVLIGTATTSPYAGTWNNVASGSYSLTAKITDSLGGTATSNPVAITVVDAMPPSANLTAPIAGTVFTSTATITISANATAATGATVSRVDFYAGSTLVGTAIASPYMVTWNEVAAGSYSLTAKVTDSLGSTGTSTAVAISVVDPTFAGVSISAPVAGASFIAPATIPITAAATAGTGATVSKVEFYAGSTLIGTATFSPYSVSWSNVAAGSYSLTAKVTDSLGGTGTSSPVPISVADPVAASINMTAPVVGASFTAPATIPLTATATAGSGATVSRVEFYAGSTLVGTVTASPYSVTWSNVAVGNYSLTAKVIDSLGGTATSTAVAISVAASIPASVSITAPVAGASFTAPATIPITATATAGTGATVSKVEFYTGSTLVGTATASPYSVTWSSVAAGNYSLTTKVTDSAGGTATSPAVEISVAASIPASVSIAAPVAGASFTAPASIPITATATAGTGAIVSKVEFYAGSTLVGMATASPYSVTWSSVAAGSYSLTAKVIDSLGGTATSTAVAISVAASIPASVSITAPVAGASFTAPATIPITATATAGTGATVSKVEFYAGSTLVGTATTSPYSVTWNNVVAGNYSLTAKVTDSLGGTATSTAVAISVAASIPASVSITAPVAGASFTAPATIPITAAATAGTGATVSKVEFYAGSTLVGTATASPYSITWSNVAAGNYSLTAKVTDSAGGTAISTAVAVSVAASIPASVNISTPVGGASFTAPATIPITATASAGTGATVSKVEFYAGSTLVGTATASPYSVTWSNVAAGSYTLTAKVTDSLGGTATSTPVSITVSGTALPSPWVTQDIGSVGLAGSATYSNGTFTLKGAGSNIGGSSDAFRYVYQSMSGDGQIVARVASIQNTNASAKSGLMIRAALTANAIHATIDVTPTSGAEFLRRSSSGGTTSATTSRRVAAPSWLKLVRSSNTFTGYVSADGVTWTQVGSSTISMPASVYVGLAVTSHSNSTLCSSTLDGVSPSAAPTVTLTTPQTGSSFTAPASIAVGATVTPGSDASVSSVQFFAGSTLIGTATSSPYVVSWNNVTAGSYSLTAKVIDSKGGTATSSPVAITVVAPVAAMVSITSPTTGASYSAPATIPITATASAGTGATITKVEFYADSTLIGTATATPYSVTWSNVAAGSYSLTAKVTDSLGGSATSGAVAVDVINNGLPAPWLTQDIGSTGVAGSATYQNSIFTIKGAGSDIWGTSDAFRFVYKSMSGDSQIIARVASLQNTSAYAKGGVMIRQSLAANSAHAMMDVTPGNGAEFSRRTTAGGSTTATTRGSTTAPYWVKLVRSGNTFTGSVSSDGANWTQVGSSTISMTGTIYIGLVVASHASGLCTATVDGVQ